MSAPGPRAIYLVVDARTGKIVGSAYTLKSAHRKADKLDRQYGAVRYTVRHIDPDGSIEQVRGLKL